MKLYLLQKQMNKDHATLVSYSGVGGHSLPLEYYIAKTGKFTGDSTTRIVQKVRVKQSRRI
jgi:hypothetical protein